MSVQDYVESEKGKQKIKTLANKLHNTTRLSIEESYRVAKATVTEWLSNFNPYGIHL